jgi:hypothetical protein
MARRRANRQGRKRAKPVLLLGKRLVLGKAVRLGGGLYARLVPGLRYRVDLTLRTRGAGDVRWGIEPDWRDTVEEAIRHAEEILIHFASALRQAGAT